MPFYPKLDPKAVIVDYASGLSCVAVAKKHDCTPDAVLKLLIRNGIKPRSKQAAGFLRKERLKASRQALAA